MAPHVRVIAVIDDHLAISEGVPTGLRTVWREPFDVIRMTTVGEFIQARQACDVVLLDVHLGDGSDPVDNVRRLTDRGWPVVLYTGEQRPTQIARCLQAGALGIVGKHQGWAVLAEAITHAQRREPYLDASWAAALASVPEDRVPDLTVREREVLRLYAAGLPLRSVANRVGVEESTAKEYLKRIRRKYSAVGRPAPTKTHLFRRAVQDGVIPPESGITELDPTDPD